MISLNFWNNFNLLFSYSKESSHNLNDHIGDEPSHVDFSIRTIFLVGLTENNETQDQIVNESHTYNDLIQESFLDSYNNLTLKSVMMLKWINTNCAGKGKQLNSFMQ